MRRNPAEERGRRLYHITCEWDGEEPPSTTIITAVAAIRGVEPASLPQFESRMDTDAVDALFAESSDRGHPSDFLSLTYAGCTVIVHRNGHVLLQRTPKWDSC